MKVITTSKLLAIGLFLCWAPAFSQPTADPAANQTTQCILQYFSGLSSKTENKVISGQWMNWRGLPNTPATEFDTSISAVFNQTSKWVGIIGTNYMRERFNPYYQGIENLKPVNQPLIDYSKTGGLVTVMVSWKNPWTGGTSGDMSNSSNLLDVITNGHPANTFFKKELDSIAVGFQQLQDSGVSVLFRPFHEMNGSWFWWGSKSATLPIAADFTALWQYTFNYLTTTKNLHNILWYYTPSARESHIANPAFKTELFYYPGHNYVDIIGLDVYNDTLSIPNYAAIVATGKPVGIAEFGPEKQQATNNPFSYDYTRLLSQVKNKYPALCHWISYNHFKAGQTNNWIFYSLSTQNNTSLLLNDNWVANREDNNISACLVLPMRLVMFSVKKSLKTNVLQWGTIDEMNTHRFDIERSLNGSHYNRISTVKAGFTNYTFTDEQPLPGINYYRLKVIDNDGKFSYSAVKSVNNYPGIGVSIYPNPVPGKLQVQMESDQQMNLQLRVFNSIGQTLLTTSLSIPAGKTIKAWDISNLEKGNYFLQLFSKDGALGLLNFDKL